MFSVLWLRILGARWSNDHSTIVPLSTQFAVNEPNSTLFRACACLFDLLLFCFQLPQSSGQTIHQARALFDLASCLVVVVMVNVKWLWSPEVVVYHLCYLVLKWVNKGTGCVGITVMLLWFGVHVILLRVRGRGGGTIMPFLVVVHASRWTILPWSGQEIQWRDDAAQTLTLLRQTCMHAFDNLFCFSIFCTLKYSHFGYIRSDQK